ncbi:MAG: tripartite tricarboxylate transporter permease [Deltaproteobacteria bacterium]|nr:tripartite tricarboxylate transporter permease [Deltaproteobacteria bacterium]
METILAGISDVITLTNILYILLGVFTGIVAGAIPGLSGITAIAIAIPFTIYLSPLTAVAFLIAINKGSTVGGAISAILLNTPGTPDATATTFDGYPLAKKGKPLKALTIALYSSVSGDTFSDMVLIVASASLVTFALKMGPIEFTAFVILSLTIIGAFAEDSMIKGLIAACFGVFLRTVGLDPESGTERLTFGVVDLMGGVPLLAVGIGTLALGEIIRQIEVRVSTAGEGISLKVSKNRTDGHASWKEYKRCLPTIFRSAIIGTFVGAIPGLGSTVAAFLGYNAAKSSSSNPEEFGTGKLEGIAAAEAANSSVVGANLIPLLLIGIPGNVAAAFLIGAFMIHGITPGPLIFESHARLIYGLFGAMVIANICNFLIGNIGLRFFALLIRAPSTIVFPVIVLFCMSGTYMIEGGLFAVGIMLAFGIVGYLMRKLRFSFVTFIIGYILGKEFEIGLRQTIIITNRNPKAMLDHPVAIIVFLMAIAFVGYITYRNLKQYRTNSKS